MKVTYCKTYWLAEAKIWGRLHLSEGKTRIDAINGILEVMRLRVVLRRIIKC